MESTHLTLLLLWLLDIFFYYLYQYCDSFIEINDATDIYLAGLLLNLFSSKSFASSLKSYWPQPKLINSAIKSYPSFKWDIITRSSDEGPQEKASIRD